jgi:putative transposase
MRDPELVVADGAMGLWKALVEVFPAARHQRCWVPKARNVTNAGPTSAQPGATKVMQEIYNAEDREHAENAIDVFARVESTFSTVKLRTKVTRGTGSPAAALAMVFSDFNQIQHLAVTDGGHLVINPAIS